jgi:hypothetical protein
MLRNIEWQASLWGVIVAASLTVLILVGSRGLAFFDPALAGYAIATIFAVIGIVYRMTIWMNHSSTKRYLRRGWQLFWNQRNFMRHKGFVPFTVLDNLFIQSFIMKRGFWRWFTHFTIFWGCLTAALVTFPLVFGWLNFILLPPDIYQIRVFGFVTPVTMPVRSIQAWMIFHALDFSAVLCIAGFTSAMIRRLRDLEVQATQRFTFDFVPLFLLLVISITGLMLTGTDLFLDGRYHAVISAIHQAIVIMGILYLPFGKFFHVIERPAAIGIELYQKINENAPQFACKRCGELFTSSMHIEDIKATLDELGFTFGLPDTHSTATLQEYCPRCKRVMRGNAYANLARKNWV